MREEREREGEREKDVSLSPSLTALDKNVSASLIFFSVYSSRTMPDGSRQSSIIEPSVDATTTCREIHARQNKIFLKKWDSFACLSRWINSSFRSKAASRIILVGFLFPYFPCLSRLDATRSLSSLFLHVRHSNCTMRPVRWIFLLICLFFLFPSLALSWGWNDRSVDPRTNEHVRWTRLCHFFARWSIVFHVERKWKRMRWHDYVKQDEVVFFSKKKLFMK